MTNFPNAPPHLAPGENHAPGFAIAINPLTRQKSQTFQKKAKQRSKKSIRSVRLMPRTEAQKDPKPFSIKNLETPKNPSQSQPQKIPQTAFQKKSQPTTEKNLEKAPKKPSNKVSLGASRFDQSDSKDAGVSLDNDFQ
jgi:hypothetical protein